MQRLDPGGVRLGGPNIETTELELRTQNVCQALQDLRHRDHTLEHFAFIDQIGEPVGLLFLLELGSGAFTLDFEELLHAPAYFAEQSIAHIAFEYHVAVTLELIACLGHSRYCYYI